MRRLKFSSALRIFLLVLLAADLAFVFFNSAKPAASSGTQSAKYSKVVAKAVTPDFDELPKERQFSIIEAVDAVVRECAHAAEFVPVGFCGYLLLITEQKRRPLTSGAGKAKRMLICAALTVAFALLYGLSDEIHQLFVEGRSFQLFDILMDFTGALAGCAAAIVLWLAVCALRRRISKTA